MAGKRSKNNNRKNNREELDVGRQASGKGTSRIVGLIRLFLGILLLPLCVGVTIAFIYNFRILGAMAIGYFIRGIIAFLIMYFLIWEGSVLYSRGQKIVSKVFGFFAPFVNIASYVFPAYVIITIVVYLIFAFLNMRARILNYAVFLMGFSQVLHLVFTARTLRKRQGVLKADYVFGFSVIYILNILILGFGFSLMFSSFSFMNFMRTALQLAGEIYRPLVSQLFLI